MMSAEKPANSTRTDLAICLAAGVFLWFLQFKFPFTPFFIENDSLIFIYEGWRMSLGDAIYRDFFVFTFPGSQTFYAALILLFGAKFWILNATVVLLGVVLCWLTIRVSKAAIDGPLAYIPAIVFIFFGMRWFGLDGSHRMFSPVFVLAAVLIAMHAASRLSFAAAGSLCAFASVFTQQRGIVVAAGIVVFLAIDGRRRSVPWLGSAAALLAGFAAALFLLCLPYAIIAGPVNFIGSTILYPQRYYGHDPNNRFGVLLADVANTFSATTFSEILVAVSASLYLFILPLAVIIFLVSLFALKHPWIEIRGITLIAIVAAALTFTTLAPNKIRLFGISGLSLIVLVWIIRQFAKSASLQRQMAVGVAIPLLLLAALQAYRIQASWDYIYLETPSGTLAAPPSPQTDRYVFLSKNTRAGDAFFEVYEPFIYFPLQLKNPTRYGQIWPSDYTRPEHVADAVSDLAANPPEFILWDNGYNLPPESRKPGDHTGRLAEFVMANYAPIGDVYQINDREIQIWKRNGLD